MVQRLEDELDREELVWDEIGKLHAHHGDVPVEIRLLKLTEEVGEVADAFLGVHGLNKRKGVCRSRDDLLDELADVIITAAVAMSGIIGDVDEARSHLERRLAAVTERAGLLPGDDRLPSRVGGVDVVDGGALVDAEDSDQVDRVGGMAGLVQDAAPADPPRRSASTSPACASSSCSPAPHPRYPPKPLQLPSSHSQQYHNFILTMPEQLDLCLRRQARSLLSKASIREPVTWEPSPGWVTGITWPGHDPEHCRNHGYPLGGSACL